MKYERVPWLDNSGALMYIWLPEDWQTASAYACIKEGLEDAIEYSIENPSHYSKHEIEPKKYIMANKLGWCEGNIVKYATRWQDKGGINDLYKGREFFDILIEEENNKGVEV